MLFLQNWKFGERLIMRGMIINAELLCLTDEVITILSQSTACRLNKTGFKASSFENATRHNRAQ